MALDRFHPFFLFVSLVSATYYCRDVHVVRVLFSFIIHLFITPPTSYVFYFISEYVHRNSPYFKKTTTTVNDATVFK
jgi:hypothetical protein